MSGRILPRAKPLERVGRRTTPMPAGGRPASSSAATFWKSRWVIVVVISVVTATGCTGESPSHQGLPTSRSPSQTGRPPANGRELTCKDGSPLVSPHKTPNDLVIGPLTYSGLLGGLPGYPTLSSPNFPGQGYFYKLGPQVAPGATVTVSVDPAARGYAALVSKDSADSGDTQITYHACPNYTTIWIGGFLLHDRPAACVPLTVTVAGEAAAQQVVASIRAGNCA